jgi:hypothetical protein
MPERLKVRLAPLAQSMTKMEYAIIGGALVVVLATIVLSELVA